MLLAPATTASKRLRFRLPRRLHPSAATGPRLFPGSVSKLPCLRSGPAPLRRRWGRNRLRRVTGTGRFERPSEAPKASSLVQPSLRARATKKAHGHYPSGGSRADVGPIRRRVPQGLRLRGGLDLEDVDPSLAIRGLVHELRRVLQRPV